jgi:hypothetical protein
VLTVARTAAALAFFQEGHPGLRSDARAAAEWVASMAASEDIVLLANPAIGPSFHYYYHGPGREIALPYTGPVLYWNDIRLWKDLNRPGLQEEAAALVRKSKDEHRRVWLIWGGVSLSQPTEYWQPFYAPRSFAGARAVLEEQFRLERSNTFNTTQEPFAILLYAPVTEKMDGTL